MALPRRSLLFLVPVAGLVFLLAADSHPNPADPIHATISAFELGELDGADPGLGAFNRAAIHFSQERYREAEIDYSRVLSDRACPPERRLRALYNRGTCRLHRAPAANDPAERAALAWAAAQDLAACLEMHHTDERLEGHARYNLELARILWARANRSAPTPKTPDAPPPEQARNPAVPNNRPETGGTEPGANSGDPETTTQPGSGSRSPGNVRETDLIRGGSDSTLPILREGDLDPTPLPKDVRLHLMRIERRLREDLTTVERDVARYRPRPDRDW